jgi:hypothetical protein
MELPKIIGSWLQGRYITTRNDHAFHVRVQGLVAPGVVKISFNEDQPTAVAKHVEFSLVCKTVNGGMAAAVFTSPSALVRS